jgi:hypothetical protein
VARTAGDPDSSAANSGQPPDRITNDRAIRFELAARVAAILDIYVDWHLARAATTGVR